MHTVHHFVLYHKDSINSDESFSFLSHDLKHGTSMVYTFICNLISHILLNLPHIKQVHYFSDFPSIYNHFGHFNIKCEWQSFATSHVKSSCNDICGVL